jgi:hypothetical protein
LAPFLASRRSILLALAISAAFGANAEPFSVSAPQHGMGALPPQQLVAARPMAVGATALPQSIDLTPWAVPVGNQGAVNSCVSWAIAHGMLGWYLNKGGTPQSFAPMYMYSQINTGGATGEDLGSRATDAMKVVLSQGNDVRSNYWQGDYDWVTQPTSAERESAKRFKYENLKHSVLFAHNPYSGGTPDHVNAIKQALANGQPVAIALAVRGGFERLSYQSPVDTDTTSMVVGLHEVLALGYNDQGLLIQNSWGTGWGQAGYGRLSWNKVQKDVFEAVVADAGNARPVCSIGVNARRLPASGGYLSATAYCAGSPTSYKWKINGADAGSASTISATLGANTGPRQIWTVSLVGTNAAGNSEEYTVQLGQDGR